MIDVVGTKSEWPALKDEGSVMCLGVSFVKNKKFQIKN